MLKKHNFPSWLSRAQFKISLLGARLEPVARPVKHLIFSSANLWEITLNNTKGQLPLPQGFLTEQMEAHGFMVRQSLLQHIKTARSLNLRTIVVLQS